MLHMTVKGKYVYEIRWINGDIEFENQGTVDKPKPKIEAVDIINKTSDTIIIKVTTLRNEGGTLKCYIKEEKEENVEYVFVKEQIEGDNTFEIEIDPDKTYSNIKVEAIAKNGETASKEVEIVNIPTLTEKTVTLSYEVNGETINQTDWTQGPVVVTVSTETEGYTLQTSQDGKTWKDAEIAEQIPSTSTKISSRATTRTVTKSSVQTSSQTFTTNGTLYARLFDKTTGQKGREYTKKITNIDKLAPDSFTPTATSTTNSITLTGSTTDATATSDYASSGIAKYYFSKDNGTTWEPTNGQTQTSYTFSDLTQNQSYSLKMKVEDNAGNTTITETVTKATGTVPAGEGNITFSYSNTDWTNGNVDVTITKKAGNDAYKLQYKKDSGEWTDITSGGKVQFTANGSITARLTDNTEAGKTGNVGTTATGNVTKIDTVKPTVSKELAEVEHSTNKIKVNITVQDKKSTNAPTTETVSGLDKIIWYYKKSTDTSYKTKESTFRASGATGATQGPTTQGDPWIEFTDLTAGTTYNIYAVVYDVAGNVTRSPAPSSSGSVSDIKVTTSTIPPGSYTISFDYSNKDANNKVVWTNKDVDVTITMNPSLSNLGFKLRYSTDSGETWEPIESGGKVTLTANGSVMAKLVDITTEGEIGNSGTSATANVTKIDKVAPTITTALAVDSSKEITNSSIPLILKAQDKKSTNAPTTETVSGLARIGWQVYKEGASASIPSFEPFVDDSTTTGITSEKDLSKTLSDLDAGTTYNIRALVYDVAGNTVTPTIKVTTKQAYTVTYNANAGSDTTVKNIPKSQTKIQGKNLPLDTTKPTRTGWTFFDWNTKSNGTGTTYNPGAIYSTNAALDLYARWGIQFTNGTSVDAHSTNMVYTGAYLPEICDVWVTWTRNGTSGDSFTIAPAFSSNGSSWTPYTSSTLKPQVLSTTGSTTVVYNDVSGYFAVGVSTTASNNKYYSRAEITAVKLNVGQTDLPIK